MCLYIFRFATRDVTLKRVVLEQFLHEWSVYNTLYFIARGVNCVNIVSFKTQARISYE